LVPSIDSGSGVQGGNNGVTSGVLNTDRANNETGSRKVLLSGPQAEVEEAIRLIEQLDMPRKQVEITVTIHDVANEALKEAGVTWNFGSFTVSENTNNSMNFGTFSRSGTSFQATMKALEQNDNAKLLASPNVSVMDGMRGFILIGEKRQFPVVNGTTPTGQFIFSTQEQNIGIYLQVAADVASDGTITLAVKPQVSAIIGFLQLNGGSYPQISTRESQSTLSLKDGQTMLLGGLLRDEEIRNLEQVPLLSKIPLFGELFKRRRTEKRSSQLVISITPKIVN
jgi:type II secretory pathway component GspD/PulD (secretin)